MSGHSKVHIPYFMEEEIRKTVGDVLFSNYKWMKRLIPKTWIKIDVDPHYFDYFSIEVIDNLVYVHKFV